MIFFFLFLLHQDKYFRLENINSPKIIVKSILDYDVVQKISLVLHVRVWWSFTMWHRATSSSCCAADLCRVFQDTFNGSASNKPFFTSVASITVMVKDIDNRPPWFQPCLRASLGTAKLCVSTGYRGRVNLTEKEVGSCFIAYDPFLPRLILCVVQIDFHGALPSSSTFVATL